MIRFEPTPEPAGFQDQARRPGQEWLAKHPEAPHPKDYWSQFRPQLAEAFRHLCAYSAMYLADGTIDHYRSCKNYPARIYEWGNYRYASGNINSRKRSLDEQILDPFEVGDDWFEILLPSLQLVPSTTLPEAERVRAEFTLKQLRLRDHEETIRQRRGWYELYELG